MRPIVSYPSDNRQNELSKAYTDRDFYLIIGADNWAAFSKWRSPEEIISRYHILVYPRPGYALNESSMPDTVRAIKSPLFEVSSTFIRKNLANGKDIRYFLHPEVYRIISEKGYYLK